MVAALLKKTEEKHKKALEGYSAEVQKLRDEIQTMHSEALLVSAAAAR